MQQNSSGFIRGHIAALLLFAFASTACFQAIVTDVDRKFAAAATPTDHLPSSVWLSAAGDQYVVVIHDAQGREHSFCVPRSEVRASKSRGDRLFRNLSEIRCDDLLLRSSLDRYALFEADSLLLIPEAELVVMSPEEPYDFFYGEAQLQAAAGNALLNLPALRAARAGCFLPGTAGNDLRLVLQTGDGQRVLMELLPGPDEGAPLEHFLRVKGAAASLSDDELANCTELRLLREVREPLLIEMPAGDRFLAYNEIPDQPQAAVNSNPGERSAGLLRVAFGQENPEPLKTPQCVKGAAGVGDCLLFPTNVCLFCALIDSSACNWMPN